MTRTTAGPAVNDADLKIRRHFTNEGVHPYDELEWELRDAVIQNFRTGEIAFEQKGVEVPRSWSQNATNIASQKYFRGTLGTPQRERSVRQMIDRVVGRYREEGLERGYFADADEAQVFQDELTHLLVTQKAAFNSPVWFNVGWRPKGEEQVSACQPYHSLVSTPAGLVPIGKLVEENAVGLKVYDAEGVTRIVAVKANGTKDVLRVHTKAGHALDVTADHLVWKKTGDRSGRFVQAGELQPGDALVWHRRGSFGEAELDVREMREAALAGWLQSDGFVGQYAGTNRSLTVEAMTVNDAELAWVTNALDAVFPDVHRHERTVETKSTHLDCRRTRLYGNVLRSFVEKWDLRTRGVDMKVPEHLFTAPLPVVAAYLRSLFQAEGSISLRERSARIAMDMISEDIIRGAQRLLLRFGIFARVGFKPDPREDRRGCWSLSVQSLGDRRLFAMEIGFIDPVKSEKLERSFEIEGHRSLDVKTLEIKRIESLGPMEVFDIQTESGEYLSENLRVHNCFILSVDDEMNSILNWYVEEGTIFKHGSGAGINLSAIRSSKERLKSGGTASGPVSFMRGADASAGTIKSGGATRRAAKMVILNVDHPDIKDFIWCKALEERKARALRESGFDMDLDGKDSHSIQYQNANNSVRVTDDFMQAVLEDREWDLKAVTTEDTVETVKAKELLREISDAAWDCADPGMQYDTTINDWHTSPNSGRINGSNPCFTGDARVHTDKGLIRFDDMMRAVIDGETYEVYTNDITNPDNPQDTIRLSKPSQFMVTGTNEVLKLRFSDGREIRCTPNHRFWTENRGWVRADELTFDDTIRALDRRVPAAMATRALPVPTSWRSYAAKGTHSVALNFPEKWSEEFAHYLGWLVGDGCISNNTVSTIYGSEEDRNEILPRHLELLTEINGGVASKPSVQANGTVQLRLSRGPFARFIEALGVKPIKAARKEIPWSLFEAPEEIVRSFLQGLFDAAGCASDGKNGTRYVGLGSKSQELLRGAQLLLSTLGIYSRVYDVTGTRDRSFEYTRKDGSAVTYRSEGGSFDLRIPGKSIETFAGLVSFGLERKATTLRAMVEGHTRYVSKAACLLSRASDGYELTYNLTEPVNHSYMVNGLVVSNCSEYMHVDNSSCNLASLNLMKFVSDEDVFDIEGYKHAVEVMFLAQEISVGFASYPTEAIADNSRRFRQLGQGYANLGALLMASGLAYDSDKGRAWAAAITALMTGHCYATSAKMAKRVGVYEEYEDNRDPHIRVMNKHRDAAYEIPDGLAPAELVDAARASWDEAVALGEMNGYRNAQATVLAPTGTIGLLMDCDTTGIEPDLALKKTKKLVGGGTMSIVNQTVPRALRKLGYDENQVKDIVAYIDDNSHVVGAPHLREEHMTVFDTAMGDRSIHYMGHIKMMSAVQPFISGAISKCVTGETLLTTNEGLIRIKSLYEDEEPDTFRDEVIEVVSTDGPRKTDAFYYGGLRKVREVQLRSGHRVAGTENHRLLIAGGAELTWKTLAEIKPGDYVATQYGSDMWADLPASLRSFEAVPSYGSQKKVCLPQEMTEDLALLLGAFVAEGHITRSNWTLTITNSYDSVLMRMQEAFRDVFGVEGRITRQAGKCPALIVSSKTVVEFFDFLECGGRASNKRIPDAVLRSPRSMVLAFLSGLFLDAYVHVGRASKFGICVDSPKLLDDLQAVLTNLGVVHGRITKRNRENGKSYDEVYATGEHAQWLLTQVKFLEPHKAYQAARFDARGQLTQSTADVVPGISGRELYQLIPTVDKRAQATRHTMRHLLDVRTKRVSRRSLERVAAIPGVELPGWLRMVLQQNLRFSPVSSVQESGIRKVYDISVPETHAFVGNGVVNHNTVNLPENVTVEDVENAYIEGWKLGLKALALYRDNCKVGQPLSATKKDVAKVETAVTDLPEPVRRRLGKRRSARTYKFRVADTEGYITTGEFPDGTVGEIFLKVAKQGSTLAGIMDAFAISISMGLQYGVPLSAYVKQFVNTRFEPSGMTDDPDFRIATSVLDYVFRLLALEYLAPEERRALNIRTSGERVTEIESKLAPGDEEKTNGNGNGHTNGGPAESVMVLGPVADSHAGSLPFCGTCGVQMHPAGSCFACPACGSTSGCS
ncbi:MAG: LAGLIDADG family homing endonuclease [Actinomycetota bacterium]